MRRLSFVLLVVAAVFMTAAPALARQGTASLRVTVLSRSARFPVIVLGDRDGKLFNDLVYRPDVISTDNTVVHAVSDVLLPPNN